MTALCRLTTEFLKVNKLLNNKKDRKTERQRDRETERQSDRETERQRDRETERQRDRETDKEDLSPSFTYLNIIKSILT